MDKRGRTVRAAGSTVMYHVEVLRAIEDLLQRNDILVVHLLQDCYLRLQRLLVLRAKGLLGDNLNCPLGTVRLAGCGLHCGKAPAAQDKMGQPQQRNCDVSGDGSGWCGQLQDRGRLGSAADPAFAQHTHARVHAHARAHMHERHSTAAEQQVNPPTHLPSVLPNL